MILPANDGPAQPESGKIAAAKLRYAQFLANNPSTELASFEHEGDERLFFYKPWDDRSVAIEIPFEDAGLVAALEHLHLPARYTAIFHHDERFLEVIWTAYKLDDEQQELVGRKFTLQLPKSSYECEFTDSSPRLLELARHSVPLAISGTGFRNLSSFSAYLNRDEDSGEEEISPFGKPLSFFIRGVDWDDDIIIDLIRHVNFYLRYYDSASPVVEIHPASNTKAAPKNRYFDGFDFPKSIVSPSLDPKLLIMYSSGFSTASISTNFLNLYRVVEYVSFDYMHDQARKEVKSIISRPHALHDADRTSTELMLVLREIKTEREQEAIPKFLKEVIKPEQLWKELEPNRSFFQSATEFEGGLKVDAIATEKSSAETFGLAGVDAFARACTKIRNGLAHGRDKVSADSILPTSRNFDLLRPWVNALLVCAGEVVLYSARH